MTAASMTATGDDAANATVTTDTADTTNASTPAAPPALEPSSGADVLLVDDEESLRMIAGEALRIGGHRVTTAADGEEAVAAVRARAFDLVILDVNMPRLDGWSTLEQILALRPEQRVLMASGFANEDEALARGAIGLMPKPYDLRALVDAATHSLSPR